MSGTLQALADRQAIIDLLVRYATALDKRDWALLRSCFTPDGTVDYRDYGGIQQGEAIIEHVRSGLAGLDVNQHLLGNFVVDIQGDSAHSSCYVYCQHTIGGLPGGSNFLLGGTYIDNLRRSPGGWQIAQRTLITHWTDGNPAVMRAGAERIVGIGGDEGARAQVWLQSVKLPDQDPT